MARKRVTVKQWIEDALSDADKGKPCSALSLVLLKGAGQEEIHTRDITGPQDTEKLATFFVNKATGYAQDLPGTQTFKLLAFYGQAEPQASFPFTVAEGSLTAGESASFEASPQGLLAQLMKYNLEITKMNLQITQSIAVNSLQREQDMQRERNEMNVILRDMLLSMRNEEHAMRIKELEFARSTEERRMLGKAIPSIANFLTGRELIPEAYADSELIDALALQVNPEDLQMLASAGKIKPEVAALLAHRFSKAREENEKRKRIARALPPEEHNDVLAELNGKENKGELQ
jgi:hypothetical protein